MSQQHKYVMLYSMTGNYWEFLLDLSQYFSSFIRNTWYWFDILLVNSSQYYNVMALIFVSHLYGVDYLPFNQPSIQFEKNYKISKNMLKERLYGWDDFFRYRNNNAAETAAICDTTFIL